MDGILEIGMIDFFFLIKKNKSKINNILCAWKWLFVSLAIAGFVASDACKTVSEWQKKVVLAAMQSVWLQFYFFTVVYTKEFAHA